MPIESWHPNIHACTWYIHVHTFVGYFWKLIPQGLAKLLVQGDSKPLEAHREYLVREKAVGGRPGGRCLSHDRRCVSHDCHMTHIVLGNRLPKLHEALTSSKLWQNWKEKHTLRYTLHANAYTCIVMDMKRNLFTVYY